MADIGSLQVGSEGMNARQAWGERDLQPYKGNTQLAAQAHEDGLPPPYPRKHQMKHKRRTTPREHHDKHDYDMLAAQRHSKQVPRQQPHKSLLQVLARSQQFDEKIDKTQYEKEGLCWGV